MVLALYAFLVDKPENTRRTYRAGIKQFLALANYKSLDQITVAEAAAYKRWLVDKQYSHSTVCTRLAAIDSFFEFLTKPIDNGKPILTSNPFMHVTRKDVLPTPFGRAKYVEWDDFVKMIEALPKTDTGYRDRALLTFLAYTGRRRAEAAKLRVRDLDLTSQPRTYRVVVKGGQEKTFELPKVAYDAISAHWLQSARFKTFTPDSAVFAPVGFCSADPNRDTEKPMSNATVYEIVKRAAVRAGLDPNKVTVHALRHMAAHDLDRAGARLQDIQRFLGHAQPNTTAIYLQQLRGPTPALTEEFEKVRKAAISVAMPIVSP